MDKCDIKELEGRKLLAEIKEQLQITKLIFNRDKYGHWDAIYKNKDKQNVLVEIKTRDKKYENYDTHLMQQNKFDWLREAQKHQKVDKILYINFFGNNSCYIYDLDDIEEKAYRDIVNCNNSTSYFREKVDKSCLMIPKEIGIHLIKENGIWKQL